MCQVCGYFSPQWLGKCPNCGSWGSLIEEIRVTNIKVGLHIPALSLSKIKLSKTPRTNIGIQEFDRVLGGGIVPGSLTLIGGEPGIGKSTLLLQSASQLAQQKIKVLYISGEESPAQIKLRTIRLNIEQSNIYVLAQTDITEIINEIKNQAPDVIIIDSIQSIYHPDVTSLPGSVTQVRECTLKLMQIAKYKGIPVFIIGHVTKGGIIAGPKTLEHLVDTVLYIEGDKNHYYRILRAVKNRFGSTNEIGVFEMKEKGLQEVKDPSSLFLQERQENSQGTIVTCAMEGSRPFLVEIQSLLAPCGYRMPQRVSAGIDYKRVAMLLAVVERRVGIKVSTQDVFLNVVGGLHIDETACDLAIILSIISGAKNSPVLGQTVVLGEVGLTGEVRPIGLIERRLKEIERLGFTHCIIPLTCKNFSSLSASKAGNIKITGVRNIGEAISASFS